MSTFSKLPGHPSTLRYVSGNLMVRVLHCSVLRVRWYMEPGPFEVVISPRPDVSQNFVRCLDSLEFRERLSLFAGILVGMILLSYE